jgi:hypothetical protein
LAPSISAFATEIAAEKSRMHPRRSAAFRGASIDFSSEPIELPSGMMPQATAPWIPASQKSFERSRSVAPIKRESLITLKRGSIRRASAVTASAISATVPFTGINPYWRYEEGAIPGVGRWFVNVGGSQNLVVQSTDMDIPNKGIDLAFRRTYNSQSQHDYNGTDGSQISNYGDGWTNTFDAHIAFNGTSTSSGPGISLYDIDGARYDFVATSVQGSTTIYAPPVGHAGDLMQMNGNFACWFKKSGTSYCFARPDFGTINPGLAGDNGRLIEIFGRNRNNFVSLTYQFDSSTTSAQNLNEVTATTEAGQTAKLLFTDVTIGSGTRRLLTSLTRPDGVYITYGYTSTGQLQGRFGTCKFF